MSSFSSKEVFNAIRLASRIEGRCWILRWSAGQSGTCWQNVLKKSTRPMNLSLKPRVRAELQTCQSNSYWALVHSKLVLYSPLALELQQVMSLSCPCNCFVFFRASFVSASYLPGLKSFTQKRHPALSHLDTLTCSRCCRLSFVCICK